MDAETLKESFFALQQELLKNPKTRKRYLETVKELYPDYPIPEIDEPRRIEEAVSGVRKEVESIKEELKKREIEEKIAREREKIASRGAPVEEIEKLMSEKGIADYDVAFEYWQSQKNLASSEPSVYASLDKPFEFDKILKDPVGWRRKQIAAFFANKES